MVRELNVNKKNELKLEMKNQFPNLTDENLKDLDTSYEKFINNISLNTQMSKEEVEKLVANKIEYINSKHLI